MISRKKLQSLSKKEKTNKLEIKRMKKEDKLFLRYLKKDIKNTLIDSANKGLYYCEINLDKWKHFNFLNVKEEVIKILNKTGLYYEFKNTSYFNGLCVKIYWVKNR